jgi:predicted lipoprotein with Yx(FWY)xxD motif
MVKGKPKPGAGVTAPLTTVKRGHGTQLAVGQQPLYVYVGDTAPGAATGQATDTLWFIVAPDGTAITGTS